MTERVQSPHDDGSVPYDGDSGRWTDALIAEGQRRGINRQCSIGYHDECSDPPGDTCRCACHPQTLEPGKPEFSGPMYEDGAHLEASVEDEANAAWNRLLDAMRARAEKAEAKIAEIRDRIKADYASGDEGTLTQDIALILGLDA